MSQVSKGVTDCFYKVCQLLQSAAVIKKWDVKEVDFLFY